MKGKSDPQGIVDAQGRRLDVVGQIIEAQLPVQPLYPLADAIADNPRPRAEGMPVVDGTTLRRGIRDEFRR